MSRPLKDRPFGDDEENVLDRLSKVIDDPFPHDPELLRKLVDALLRRIHKKSPKEALFLTGHIRNLAAAELEFSLPCEKRAKIRELFGEQDAQLGDELLESFCGDTLSAIREASIPRGNHAADTLQFQQSWLTQFLKSFPVSAPPKFDEYSEWLTRHRRALLQHLASVPCVCRYRDSLDGISKNDLISCTGPAQLIDVVLAELHTSATRAAIRKILSHARSK